MPLAPQGYSPWCVPIPNAAKLLSCRLLPRQLLGCFLQLTPCAAALLLAGGASMVWGRHWRSFWGTVAPCSLPTDGKPHLGGTYAVLRMAEVSCFRTAVNSAVAISALSVFQLFFFFLPKVAAIAAYY